MANQLSDEFLKDLEDLSDDDQAPNDQNQEGLQKYGEEGLGSLSHSNSIKEISKLKLNSAYQSHLDSIREDLDTIYEADKFINLTPSDPIYVLIKRSILYLNEINDEITLLHKEIRDIYLEKFRELESIVYDPLEYVR